MRSLHRGLVCVALSLVGRSSVTAQGFDTALASLVGTERAFSALSERAGAKVAFLTYLADSGILFRGGGPAYGKATWSSASNPPIVLTWRPAYAAVATSGDVGFTTGPYESRPVDSASGQRRYGFYASVWRREADGRWKLTVDLGAPVKRSATPLPDWVPPSNRPALGSRATRPSVTSTAGTKFRALKQTSPGRGAVSICASGAGSTDSGTSFSTPLTRDPDLIPNGRSARTQRQPGRNCRFTAVAPTG